MASYTPAAAHISLTSSSMWSAFLEKLGWHDSKTNRDESFLNADEAFIFSHRFESTEILLVHWQIAAGYYLYRDRLKFAAVEGDILGSVELPSGKIKKDATFGDTEVYYQELTVKLPLKALPNRESATLSITYQGCAEAGLCYPPLTKTITVKLLPSNSVPSNGQQVVENVKVASQSAKLDISTPEDALLADTNTFLEADAAFVFSADFADRSHLSLQWQIAPGYYLYRQKFAFSLQEAGKLGIPQFPATVSKDDPEFGQVEVYAQPLLEIVVPIDISTVTEMTTLTLIANYQGCAEAGLCYPPISKTVTLTLDPERFAASPLPQMTEATTPVISEQDKIVETLAHQSIFYSLMLFFGLGLLLAFTPCVFPMIPILSSLIVGQGESLTTLRAFLLSLTYVLAMSVAYTAAGVSAGLLGQNLQAALQDPWVLGSFAFIFGLLALSMFGFYELQVPASMQTRLTAWSNRQRGGTFVGVAIMGFLSALIVGPCVAAPLAGALMYISHTGDALLGGMALFSMSMGMGIPLILLGMSAGKWLPRAGIWMTHVKAVFGVALLAVAIWLVERIVPTPVTLLLWASLLIISAVYLGALENLPAGVSGWRKFWKGLGVLLLIYGILLMIGAATGNGHLFKPLAGLNVANSSPSSTTLPFRAIKGLEELNRELATAKVQNKPVILDFYADWCIACKEMEQFTFTDAQVQHSFSQFILLRADVTANDALDQALSQHFGIFGPPAVLFFTAAGQEQVAYRVIGFMPATPFYQHLRSFLKNL